MSQSKDDDDVDPSCIHIISDSEDSSPHDNGLATHKRFSTDEEKRKATPSARKKLKIDGDRVEANDEVAIDIDSISTNPRRTRTCTKVSSDTSSKFPVSSPSDAMVVACHRKKYVKNTLPAGAFERMLATVAQSHPLMTYQEKLVMWSCCSDLSDVEDVNNFDDQFQGREQQYKRSTTGRRSNGKDSPHPNYNYQHFRTVILESLKGSPTTYTPPPEATRTQNNINQPSCSKQLDAVLVAFNAGAKAETKSVIQHEKIICPSSESSVTKASPSIRLHWTDEDSVFRLNRQNPEIDKHSKLIKLRVDYNKQVNLKSKINEVFKTPTVPLKYNYGCDSPEQMNSLECTSEVKSVDERVSEVQKATIQKIETRRSTGGKSADSRRGVERKSSDKLPEVTSFQQDEFCNYLGLGMNGKVYSPTPTDNKRRSLRVRRQQQQVEQIKKNKEKEIKTETDKEKSEDDKIIEKDEEVTTTVDETRNSPPSPVTIKILERTTPEETRTPRCQKPPATEVTKTNKTSGIKILLQIQSSPTTQTTPQRYTRSTATTPISAPLPTRRLRRTRTTSNGTSTCPRSSQSDESPSKATPRRKRIHHHTRRNNNASERSESLHSDHQVHDGSPSHNGRASTVPSSEGRKEDIPSTSHPEAAQVGTESLHTQFQRYLEESRKNRPSIFIVDSIDNNGPKAPDEVITNKSEFCDEQPQNGTTFKGKKWSKKRKIHRRLLRRNGTTFGGSLNQRILRNRKIVRPLRIKISRQPLGKKTSATKNKHIKTELTEKKDNNQSTVQHSCEKESKPKEEKAVPVEQIHNDKCMQTKIEIESCNKSQDDNVLETVFQQVAEEKPTTVDVEVQTEPYTPQLPITSLTSPASHTKNPLSSENGNVVYAYHELDLLTVVQDNLITFWKTCKLLQLLCKPTCEWVYLGECKRLLYDEEITTPYKNRICVHNSIPIYMEMRAKVMDKFRRECNLISVYINVYYYHDEDLVAKSHSIQLDTVASIPRNVVFTTITESRYFVMCWSQENLLGKPRSGLCKYSLTPHLDTLASIRDFKSMRHEIRYLECTTDDNLIGFGDTQVTLWDHRSGDILMNYDLGFQLGTNVGSIYYPSLEVGHDNTVLIFQKTSVHELSIIAINISHSAPSHRLICTHVLPSEFNELKSSIRTEDYVILTNAQHQELWIDCANPKYMMTIKTKEGCSRFYARCKQNVIDIADDHLALESFSNLVLKMIDVID